MRARGQAHKESRNLQPAARLGVWCSGGQQPCVLHAGERGGAAYNRQVETVAWVGVCSRCAHDHVLTLALLLLPPLLALLLRDVPLLRMHIQYKYVVRNKDGSVVRWQEGANVSLDLPGGNTAELALDVEDSWNKSKQVGGG